MIIYTMKAILLLCQILIFFSLGMLKRKSRSHGKHGNIKRKTYTEKCINTSLKDHGYHGLLSTLSSLPI